MGAGGIIIIRAAIDARLKEMQLTVEQKAALVRAASHQYTSEVHNWFGRKWIEIKAVFGSHG